MDRVDFRWPGTQGFELAIDRLIVQRGERVLLLGPSGAGKSTLLSLVCGIVVPRRGFIDVLGQNLAAMRATERDRFRVEHYGIIFQMFNLLPYASALDNVLLPLSFAPERHRHATTERQARDEAARLLAALGVDWTLATKDVAARLSVGQQQRVAAARALIGAPELIVADEPTSALDKKTQEGFLDLLFGQVEDAGATLIMVSHDDRLTPRFDRALELSDIASMRHGVEA
ncbi:MAG: ATP-binding cassette domain-containing protein [Hyphomicrobiales bacterium]